MWSLNQEISQAKHKGFSFSLEEKSLSALVDWDAFFIIAAKMQISCRINGRTTAALLTLETHLKATNRGDWTVILIFHLLVTSWSIVENKHYNLKDTPASHILQLLNVCECEFCHEKRSPLFKLLKIRSYSNPDCCPPWRSAPSWVASCILSWRAICRVGSQLTRISLTVIEYGLVTKETF